MATTSDHEECMAEKKKLAKKMMIDGGLDPPTFSVLD